MPERHNEASSQSLLKTGHSKSRPAYSAKVDFPVPGRPVTITSCNCGCFVCANTAEPNASQAIKLGPKRKHEETLHPRAGGREAFRRLGDGSSRCSCDRFVRLGSR